MTYTAGIPSSGNSIPANDRTLISQNFTQLNTQFSVDHTALTAGSLNGYHTTAHFTVQGSDPASTSNAPIVYSKVTTYGASNSTDLYYRQASNDVSNPSSVVQLTNAYAKPVVASTGVSYLPGGIIMQWGNASFANGATSSGAITFAVPFLVAVYSFTLAPVTTTPATEGVYGYNLSGLSGATLYRGSAGGITTYTWMAIGK